MTGKPVSSELPGTACFEAFLDAKRARVAIGFRPRSRRAQYRSLLARVDSDIANLAGYSSRR